MTDNTIVRDLLVSAGVRVFSDRSLAPTARAQDNLAGRTHYADPSTLRYFHSRIVASDISCAGCLFWLIESSAKEHQNTARGFRAVVFDVFGAVVYRPDLDNMTRTSAQARKAMYAWLDQFDVASYYAEELTRRADALARESQALAQVAEKIRGAA